MNLIEKYLLDENNISISPEHDKLRSRYYKNVSKRVENARNNLFKAESEFEKITSIMRKKGIDQLVNFDGKPFLNKDDEFNWGDALA